MLKALGSTCRKHSSFTWMKTELEAVTIHKDSVFIQTGRNAKIGRQKDILYSDVYRKICIVCKCVNYIHLDRNGQ